MLRIAVSGYYGFKNAGDDAILTALVTTLRALAPGVEITVFSHSPAETRQLYGTRVVNRWNPFGITWALLHSDLLLSGGGGLLQDVTGVRSICYYLVVVLLALAMGRPVVYYAQGVGPVRTRFGRWLTRTVSNRVDLITVRDQASRDDFLGMGVTRPPLVVTADPVLALNPSQFNVAGGAELLEAVRRQSRLDEIRPAELEPLAPAAGPTATGQEAGAPGEPAAARRGEKGAAGCRLGIVIRDWSGDDRYKKCIAAAADRFARGGWEVVLIPFHYPADVQVCKEVSWLMQEQSLLVRNWQTVGALFGLLQEMDLVLAMRLHAIVMSSVMRVPCVGISYDPKVERFLELTGQPDAGGVAGLEEERLYRLLLETWERRQEIMGRLDKVLVHLKQQAWETASLTLSVFYARTPGKRRDQGRSSSRGAGELLRGPGAGKGRSLKQ